MPRRFTLSLEGPLLPDPSLPFCLTCFQQLTNCLRFDTLSSAFYFQQLPTVKFCNSFLLITIRIAPGGYTPSAKSAKICGLQSSVDSSKLRMLQVFCFHTLHKKTGVGGYPFSISLFQFRSLYQGLPIFHFHSSSFGGCTRVAHFPFSLFQLRSLYQSCPFSIFTFPFSIRWEGERPAASEGGPKTHSEMSRDRYSSTHFHELRD